jgi:hypothetical protein
VAEHLHRAADDLAPAQERWRELNADPEKKADADAALRSLRAEVKKRVESLLEKKIVVRDAVEGAVLALADVPDLFVSAQERIAELVKSSPAANAAAGLAAAVRRAEDFLVIEERPGGKAALQRAPDRMTAGDRAQLRTLHLAVLATALLPEFLERSNAPAWVDPRISAPKAWRDVHHYSADGSCTGWTRITGRRQHEFDAIGQLLPDGPGGRCVRVKFLREEKSPRLIFAPE